MNIVIKNLKTKTDAGKTTVELAHVYQPLEDEKDLKIHCQYLKPGEMTAFFSYGQDGKAATDFQKIFREKVTKIDGLTVEADGKEIKIETSEDLLNLPNIPVLSTIVINTAGHLLSNDGLTGDEEKN